jgi:hypothetical protein
MTSPFVRAGLEQHSYQYEAAGAVDTGVRHSYQFDYSSLVLSIESDAMLCCIQ